MFLNSGGAPLVTWNEYSRDLRKGIYLGKEGRSLVLFIPADFDSVEHFGVNCALHKIEVTLRNIFITHYHIAINLLKPSYG